jgi:uncharacterized repeat protein (TIGR02543 family)
MEIQSTYRQTENRRRWKAAFWALAAAAFAALAFLPLSALGDTSQVIKVGASEYYKTLSDAVASAAGDENNQNVTFQLTSDVYQGTKQVDVNLPAGAEWTIDLGTHTLSTDNSKSGTTSLVSVTHVAAEEGTDTPGTLNIVGDSSVKGTISCTDAAPKYAVQVSSNNVVNMSNVAVNFDSSKTSGINGLYISGTTTGNAVLNADSCAFTVKNSYINAENGNGGSAFCARVGSNTTASFSQCSFTAEATANAYCVYGIKGISVKLSGANTLSTSATSEYANNSVPIYVSSGADSLVLENQEGSSNGISFFISNESTEPAAVSAAIRLPSNDAPTTLNAPLSIWHSSSTQGFVGMTGCSTKKTIYVGPNFSVVSQAEKAGGTWDSTLDIARDDTYDTYVDGARFARATAAGVSLADKAGYFKLMNSAWLEASAKEDSEDATIQALYWTAVPQTEPEAVIGDVEYTTLADALAAKKDGDVIKLGRDIYLAESISFTDSEGETSPTYTLDLNGHDIVCTTRIAPVLNYSGSGTLNIVDSVTNADSAAAVAHTITDATSPNGYWTATSSSKYKTLQQSATLVNSGTGTLQVSGVRIHGTFNCIYNSGEGSTSVENCKVEQSDNVKYSNTKNHVFWGSNITATNNAVVVNSYSASYTAYSQAGSGISTFGTRVFSGTNIKVYGGSYQFDSENYYLSSAIFDGTAGNDISIDGIISYDLGGRIDTVDFGGGGATDGKFTTRMSAWFLGFDTTTSTIYNTKAPQSLKLGANFKPTDMSGNAQPVEFYTDLSAKGLSSYSLKSYRGAVVFEPMEGVDLQSSYGDELSDLLVDTAGNYTPVIEDGNICWSSTYHVRAYGAAFSKQLSGAGVYLSFTERYNPTGTNAVYYLNPTSVDADAEGKVTFTLPETVSGTEEGVSLVPEDAHGTHVEWTGKWFVSKEWLSENTLKNTVEDDFDYEGAGYLLVDAGESISIDEDDIDQDIYIWPQIKHTQYPYYLSYELNGGDEASIANNTAEFTVPYGSPSSIQATMTYAGKEVGDGSWTLDDPTRVGYTFDGWYLDKDFTTKVASVETLSQYYALTTSSDRYIGIDDSTVYGKYTYEDSQAKKPAATLYAKWKIASLDLSNTSVKLVNDNTTYDEATDTYLTPYVGSEIEPKLEVTYTDPATGESGPVELTAGEDYTIDYGDADLFKNLGTYTLTIKGTGTEGNGCYNETTLKVEIVKGTLEIDVPAESVSLSYGQAPSNLGVTASDEHVTLLYKSSDTSVVTVDDDGNVTPVSTGKATITVYSDDENYEPVSKEIAVTVTSERDTSVGTTTLVNDGAASGLYLVTGEDTLTLVKSTSDASAIGVNTVTIDGHTWKVTAIADGAFAGSKAKTVTIGSNVTSIASKAFSGDTALTSVTIGSNVTSIGASAFQGCTALKTVKGGAAVKTIGASAFKGCKKLTSITIGSKVTSIGKSAFQGCTSLKTVKGGASVKTIGASAFKGCSKLSTFKVTATSKKLKTIGKNAFSGAKKLKKITVKSKKLKTIGKSAFSGAKKLKTLTIKSKKLTKKSVKGSLKGSKVKTVKVKVGSKKLNKKYVKKYKKFFSKKNCGKKVAVK